jgi:hypothetical protein
MDAATPRHKTPIVAGAAAAAGLVGGAVLGARKRSGKLFGVPVRRRARLEKLTLEVARAGKAAAVAGRALGDLDADLRAVREQADQSRKQSPIEVVLSALTSRRLPRHG